MSRGPGVLQQRILGVLQLREEVPVGQLCWELAEEAKAIDDERIVGPIRSGELRPSFYSGFRRALNGLCATGSVVVSSRVLTEGNVALVYSYRTLRLEVLELRRLILPHLVRYAQDKGFNWEEVEERIVQNLDTATRLPQCQAKWATLETRLWHLGNDESLRYAVLPLIVRGSGYFGKSATSVHVPGSFAQQVKAAKDILPQDVIHELQDLYRLAFAQEDRQRVVSKGRFFAFADFGRNQKRVQLNDEALNWLVDEMPEVVKKLDGFVEGKPALEGEIDLADWVAARGHAFPQNLRALVDRRIFEEHEFARAS